MKYAGLTEGGSSGAWKAMLTDGGKSAQMVCGDFSQRVYRGRPVPQIFALKNKN